MPPEAFEWRYWGIAPSAPPPPPPTYVEVIGASAPDVWYRFTQPPGPWPVAGPWTMADASGHNRPGSYLSGSTTTANAPVYVPGLLDEDTDTALTVGPGVDTPAAAWQDSDAFTYEAIIKPTAANKGIAGRYVGTSTGTVWYAQLNADLSIRMAVRSSAGVLTTGNTPLNVVTLNARHHLVLTCGGGSMAVWVNGAKVWSGPAPALLKRNAAMQLRHGGILGGTVPTFAGIIDEAAYYASRVLSDAEISAHYKAMIRQTTAPPPDTTPRWVTDPDLSHALVSFTVKYGRTDATSRCKPLQSTAELAGDAAGPCPSSGDRFRVALADAAAAALGLTAVEACLFTGEVTDPRVDPVSRTYEITGMGRLGRASRRTLKTADWKVEDDGDRVTRILGQAKLDPGYVDPGTVNLLAPDGNASAGNLLETVTDSSGGSLVEQPDGTNDYHDANHRRGVPVTLTLTAGQIDNRLTWEQHVDDLINEMTVGWKGGEVVAEDSGSVRERDSFPGKITTALVSASDAHALGQLIVARRSEPVWQLPNLEVDLMRMVDPATRAALLRLRHGHRIKVTGIPLSHPYNGDVEFFVEGWSMRVDRPIPEQPWRWKLALSVSDPSLSGVSVRWTDMPAGRTWQAISPSVSWFDLARIEDPADI